MSYDEVLANRVRTALRHARAIKEKKMFGGIMFMVRNKMCVSVGKDRIMCRIDPEIHDTTLQRQGCRAVVMKGRQYRGYVYVNKEVLTTKAALGYWVELAMDYNRRVKASSRKRTDDCR